VIYEIVARRPEIQQAFLQYEAAVVREGVSANESLPELDLVREAVTAGNAERRDFGKAFGDERFGGLADLRFSIPIGYDERDARYERRRL
jgi:outer membrane protein TolC